MRKLSNLEPVRVFDIFEDISLIPRGSGDTSKISDYCVDFARKHDLSWRRDSYNNVIIRKKPSPGYESHEPVMLQGHLDMVCEKEADCEINFEKDGLNLVVADGYIYAKGTTLGGDDGIAVAMALAVLEDHSLKHPEIIAVFTSDEETGMDGAANIDMSDINSKTLINIDSEEEGVFTVSCAGGVKCTSAIPLEFEKNLSDCYKLCIYGLMGGHSGMEIDKGKLNAIVVMSKLLKYLSCKFELQLCDFHGGLKDNAIPRECTCVLSTSVSLDTISEACDEFQNGFLVGETENFSIKTENTNADFSFTEKTTHNVIEFLNTVPNGVIKMSDKIENLVQTSLNLGVANCKGDKLYTTFCVRSSVNLEKCELSELLKSITYNFNGEFIQKGEYPAWEYKNNSKLRDCMMQQYIKMFGGPPVISAIHAGLECGLFCEKIEGLDAVSFGPNILDIHTPQERLEIASVQRMYTFLCNVLEAM